MLPAPRRARADDRAGDVRGVGCRRRRRSATAEAPTPRIDRFCGVLRRGLPAGGGRVTKRGIGRVEPPHGRRLCRRSQPLEDAGRGEHQPAVLIEDTRELQCAAPNLVALRTKDGVISLSDLVRSSLRLRPDRIPIGEVRGSEALDLLKAWGTGHPGGVGTIHAGTALGALRRMEQLIQEAVVTVPRELLALAIELIVFIEGRGAKRRAA